MYLSKLLHVFLPSLPNQTKQSLTEIWKHDEASVPTVELKCLWLSGNFNFAMCWFGSDISFMCGNSQLVSKVNIGKIV